MAQNLKAGEQVTVTREIHIGKDTPAYKAGLTNIKPGQVGEVVGSAKGQGRATFVKFNGIQVSLTNQSLERYKAEQQKEQPAEKPKDTKEAKPPQPAKKPATQKLAPPAPKQASTKKPAQAQVAPEAKKSASSESDLQLVTAVANKLLLKGKMRIDKDAVVEVNLADLPEETRRQIQALIDAKLSLKP